MRILLAEDRASLRTALAEMLAREGYEVLQAAEGRSAMALVGDGGYDCALFDLKMPVHSGLDLLEASRERWPQVPVVVVTAYGSVEAAVTAMKRGAFDFLTKPVEPDHLLLVLDRALESVRQGRVHRAQAADLARLPAFQGIVGDSAVLRAAQERAALVAKTETTCLILGETGVGKELFARAIHNASKRKDQPFVAVNCAAIPETLLENELFGHEKGAYTGAHEATSGKLEAANHGTVFLDEIGEMTPSLQAKLLRALEEKVVTRVGATRPLPVDIRLLCATNRDLEAMVKDGAFRQDLYYRLSAFPVVIPPLREHPEDIPQLTEHFLDHFRRELGRPELRMSPEAMAWLAVQPWPGNVRELMNRIERAAILAPSDGGIGVEGMGAGEGSTAPAGMPALSAIEDPESWLEAETSWRAAELLRRCQGDRRRTARLLGLTQVQLDRLTGGGG